MAVAEADEPVAWTDEDRKRAVNALRQFGQTAIEDRLLDSSELDLLLAYAATEGIEVDALRLNRCVVSGPLHLGNPAPRELFIFDTQFDSRFSGKSTTFGAVFIGGCEFPEGADFGGATFEGTVSFRGDAFNVGNPGAALDLTGATFRRSVLMQVAARTIELDFARFDGPADLFVRHAVVSAEHAGFNAASVLSDSSHPGPDDDHLRRSPSDTRPRVESLRRADVANLLLSNVDLAGCHFYGVHNLDKLRIDGDPTFAKPPWPYARRWILAEEEEIRLWHIEETRPRPSFRFERYLSSRDVGALYRALRKGQEERKDEPGAADFYYGEMEMRRRAAAGVEKWLLTLYWLVSGYGLRASRAFAALLLTIAVFTVAFRWFGFEPDPSWSRAALFSAESTSSLFRVPETPGIVITQWGELLQILLRILGPLFFALMLLAIRGRVKR